MSPKRYRIPKEIELVHAYNPDFMKILDFNIKISLENLKANPTNKVKLLIKQKGLCGMCGMTLLNESGEFEHDGTTNIHHLEARSKGGSKSNINNLVLTHTECHMEHHRHQGLNKTNISNEPTPKLPPSRRKKKLPGRVIK